MMKKKLIAFDMSSFMWRGLLQGKDGENGREVVRDEKKIWINSHHHGYDNVTEYMLGVLKTFNQVPVNCILVFEGKNSKSKRQMINKDYKAKSEKVEEQYEQFHLLKERLTDLWLGLGAQVMSQDFAEGDDTCAWLARNTEEALVVATYDNDLAALNGMNDYGGNVEVWVNGLVGINKYGLFDFPLINTYKALVGDTSDGIKGVVGFGPGAFDKLCGQYGYDGLLEIHKMLGQSDLGELAELAEDPKNKLLAKIWEQAPAALNSFELAKLRPEWVNTMRAPLNWRAGMVRQLRDGDDTRFKAWYGKSRLVTGDIFEQAVAWALPLIAASDEVALDIESSQPEEADDWCALQGDDDGVDVFSHRLTGLGITFGRNNQYSLYFSVRHADTVNCDSELLRQFIAAIDKPLIIQNMSFELTVLFNEWAEKQMDNGFHGFLPNVIDTQLEAAYEDENTPRGLKGRSYSILKYEQQTYEETTKLTGYLKDLLPGGRIISESEPTYQTQMVGTGVFEQGEPIEPDPAWPFGPQKYEQGAEIMRQEFVLDADDEKIVIAPPVVVKKYKMDELPATHVLGYGLDDTICTIALHNYYKLFMQLEHSCQAYLAVEIDAAYQHAKNFIDGVDISLEKMNQLSAEDDKTYDAAWSVVRQYLIEKGWGGTVPPCYTKDITPAQVKEAYATVTGEAFDTMMRTPSKLVTFAREVCGQTIFADLLARLYAGEPDGFNKYVQSFFKGEPQFNYGSPVQKQKLLYDQAFMGMEVKVRNKATPKMKENGIFEGAPSSDNLAISYAMIAAAPREREVLESMRLMGMVTTRRSLYYSKYPYFPHWKDGKVRSSHNQSSTNTRRASESKPNKQQLPKHQKIEGQASKFREIIVPHKPGAVIVSIDFKAQELRLMAEYSQDPVMLSMYIGENKRDQHTLTGSAIAQRQQPHAGWSYETFAAALDNKGHSEFKFVKTCRGLGKKLNFTVEYGAMAPKVAATLMIPEEDAQAYIDAREELFAVAGEWKQHVIDEAKQCGYVRTMMGAVRHLRDAFNSSDRSKSSKAERQAVNFKIQGSAGEQTKMAEGRMWKDSLFYDFDAVCIGPIHDEIVASVMIVDLPAFLPRMHRAMVAPYGGMQVPIEGDISFGLDFFNQIEIGAAPKLAAIKWGVERMRLGYADRMSEKLAA